MATPAHQDLLGLEDQEAPRLSIPPSRSSPSIPVVTSGSHSAIRSPRRPPVSSSRRVSLFIKILFGDAIIWAVLSGVLTYEVFRRGLDPVHAGVGALAGGIVAAVVAIALKQVSNRVQ